MGGRRGSCCLNHGAQAIFFFEHVDPVRRANFGGGDHVIGLDGQLAATAVDESAQLDASGPTVIHQRVDRRAHRATGEHHVIDEDDEHAVERAGYFARPDARIGKRRRRVIAIQRDVHAAHGHFALFEIVDPARDLAGQRHATTAYANEYEALGSVMPLDDLARHAAQAARDALGIEQHAHRGGS